MNPSNAEPTAAAETPKLNLLQKLASAVAEIDSVDKRGTNEFQKYKYVKAADVAWMVRKALSQRNVYLVPDVIEVRNYEIPAREGVLQAVDVRMQFSFFDGDAPEVPPVVLHSCGTGTDKGDKAIYKAMTGALKYGLRHAFLIPDESDPEADAETDKATAAAKAIGNAKIAKAKEKASQPHAERPTVLFYTEPPNHNGHFLEFVNIREFLAGREDIQDSMRMIFTAHKAKKTKEETALVPAEHLQGLLEKLVGELGLNVRKLEANA